MRTEVRNQLGELEDLWTRICATSTPERGDVRYLQPTTMLCTIKGSKVVLLFYNLLNLWDERQPQRGLPSCDTYVTCYLRTSYPVRRACVQVRLIMKNSVQSHFAANQEIPLWKRSFHWCVCCSPFHWLFGVSCMVQMLDWGWCSCNITLFRMWCFQAAFR